MFEHVPDDAGLAADALARWQRSGRIVEIARLDEIHAAEIAACIAHIGQARLYRAATVMAAAPGGDESSPTASEHEEAAQQVVTKGWIEGPLGVPWWTIQAGRSTGDSLGWQHRGTLAWESVKASTLLATESLLLAMFDSASGTRTVPSWSERHHPECAGTAISDPRAAGGGALDAALEDAHRLEVDTTLIRSIALTSLRVSVREGVALRKEIGERFKEAAYPGLDEWLRRDSQLSMVRVLGRTLKSASRSGWRVASRRGHLKLLRGRVAVAVLCASATRALLEELNGPPLEPADDRGPGSCRCAIAAPGHQITGLAACGEWSARAA